jgi:hypothetical protein
MSSEKARETMNDEGRHLGETLAYTIVIEQATTRDKARICAAYDEASD